MCSDSEKNMSAFADQNHAPSLTCVRLEWIVMQEKRRNIKAVRVDNTFLTAFLEPMMLLRAPIFDMGSLNNVNVTIGLLYATFYSREIPLNRPESIRSELPTR